MMLLYEFGGEEVNLITTAFFFCDIGSLGRRKREREREWERSYLCWLRRSAWGWVRLNRRATPLTRKFVNILSKKKKKKRKENLCTLEYNLYIYTCQYGMGVESFTLLVIENVDWQVKHGLFHYKDVLVFCNFCLFLKIFLSYIHYIPCPHFHTRYLYFFKNIYI